MPRFAVVIAKIEVDSMTYNQRKAWFAFVFDGDFIYLIAYKKTHNKNKLSIDDINENKLCASNGNGLNK